MIFSEGITAQFCICQREYIFHSETRDGRWVLVLRIDVCHEHPAKVFPGAQDQLLKSLQGQKLPNT